MYLYFVYHVSSTPVQSDGFVKYNPKINQLMRSKTDRSLQLSTHVHNNKPSNNPPRVASISTPVPSSLLGGVDSHFDCARGDHRHGNRGLRGLGCLRNLDTCNNKTNTRKDIKRVSTQTTIQKQTSTASSYPLDSFQQ